jgi:hypothetical protein
MDQSWTNLLKTKWKQAAKEGYLGTKAKTAASNVSLNELKEMRKKRKEYGG